MSLLLRAEDIADEVKRRAETMTVAQSAETDVGRVVYMGRKSIDRTMLPCTVVIEGDDALDRISARLDYSVSQRYVWLMYLPCDPDHPNVAAHAAIRDAKRAIFRTDGKPDHRWGGKVKEVMYLGRDIGPRADGESFVLAIVEFTVDYVENVANP